MKLCPVTVYYSTIDYSTTALLELLEPLSRPSADVRVRTDCSLAKTMIQIRDFSSKVRVAPDRQDNMSCYEMEHDQPYRAGEEGDLF